MFNLILKFSSRVSGALKIPKMFVRNFMCFSSSLFEIHRFEELSVLICAEATSKFFALNEAVFGLEGRF